MTSVLSAPSMSLRCFALSLATSPCFIAATGLVSWRHTSHVFQIIKFSVSNYWLVNINQFYRHELCNWCTLYISINITYLKFIGWILNRSIFWELPKATPRKLSSSRLVAREGGGGLVAILHTVSTHIHTAVELYWQLNAMFRCVHNYTQYYRQHKTAWHY
jgi:hypothetical protein